jgi:L-fuculokinase
MSGAVIIVLDCGATNIRAIAVNPAGQVQAAHAVPNATLPGSENPAWHIWPLDNILSAFGQCCREIRSKLDGQQILGVTVTTFGVDGALVDAEGELLYPVISWKCPRTAPVMEAIDRYIDPATLQVISGIGAFSFNTIYKLIWLRENHPELLRRAHAWLFISSLINHRLTGRFTNDATMTGTGQLLHLQTGHYSEQILRSISVRSTLFAQTVAAGTVIGPLLPQMAASLGLPAGIPVVSTGHDTQFALFGSGAGILQPVLSSGTWEILMVRTPQVLTERLPNFPGSTCELDASPGLFNPGLQWLASGVLDWVRTLCWSDKTGPAAYDDMIAAAQAVPPGCDGVRMEPNLMPGGDTIGCGAYLGLSLNTGRAHLYRAALEALALRLRQKLKALKEIGQFTPEDLIVVGGGSKNALWNQIKSDVLELPVNVLSQSETTVLGAALFAYAGIGYYSTPELARQHVTYRYQPYRPGPQADQYRRLSAMTDGEPPLAA